MVGGSALGLRAPCGVLTAFALRGWPRACTRPSGLGSGQDTMAPLRAAPTDSPMTERESYWHHGRRCKRLAAAALPAAGAGWQQQTPCPGRGSPPARHTPWRAGPAVQACVCESVCVRVRAWSRWCAVCVCVCVSVVVVGGGQGRMISRNVARYQQQQRAEHRSEKQSRLPICPRRNHASCAAAAGTMRCRPCQPCHPPRAPASRPAAMRQRCPACCRGTKKDCKEREERDGRSCGARPPSHLPEKKMNREERELAAGARPPTSCSRARQKALSASRSPP